MHSFKIVCEQHTYSHTVGASKYGRWPSLLMVVCPRDVQQLLKLSDALQEQQLAVVSPQSCKNHVKVSSSCRVISEPSGLLNRQQQSLYKFQ